MIKSNAAPCEIIEDKPNQATKDIIGELFSEIQKIPGSFPVRTPENAILAFEVVITLYNSSLWLSNKYNPDDSIEFKEGFELIQYLVKY